MVMYETMLQERELIQKVAVLFGQNIQRLDPEGQSFDQVWDTVNDTISEMELKPTEAKVIRAFFETYLGMLMVDRQAATELVEGFMRPVM